MIVSEVQAGNPPALRTRAPAAGEGVRVGVPARLHVGFVDLNGGLGRRYGSLGIALDWPQTRIALRRGPSLSAAGPGAARALRHLEVLVEHFGLDPGLQLGVEAAIPEHIGLGSGTQLSLAVAAALCRLHGISADIRSLAQLLERGLRSSIGIATFEQGGVVLDGGRGAADVPPPVLSRLSFPDAWRVLLIFDDGRRGLHGVAETDAFQRLPPFPEEAAAHLCRVVLMAALPALAERDLDGFGGAIAELQRVIGDYFAPVQGARFMSPGVTQVLGWLESQGVRGIGQSSWGPTGFAIIGSEREAARLMREAVEHWPADTGLAFAVTRGRNRGGEVEMLPMVRG